jgi:hypothetical protein
MTFFDPALFLLGQLAEHFAQMLAQALVQHLPAPLRDEPLGVSWMDSRKCQTPTASPAEPGELPVELGLERRFPGFPPSTPGKRPTNRSNHWLSSMTTATRFIGSACMTPRRHISCFAIPC